MNKELNNETVQIMGKSYQIKCSTDELPSLHAAAAYLEEKMSQVRDGKILGVDRIAVIAALNITHQFLNIENIIDERTQDMQQRIRDLHDKIDSAFVEPTSAE